MIVTDRRGFTIPEVLVAMMILSIGILAMMGTSAATTKLISRGRRVTIATQVAESVMDSLRLKSNEDLVTCTDLASNATGYSQQGVRVTWDIGARTAMGQTGARVVTVVISYAGNQATTTDTLISVFRCDA